MGWTELLLVGVVALIVVGPKDLPVMFQALGKMTAKVRRMGREFSSAMNDAAQASGASDIAKDLREATDTRTMGLDALRDAADSFEKWDPGIKQKAVGPETAKLAAERAETARKIHAATAEREQAKRDAEEAAADEAEAAMAEADPATAPEAPKATAPEDAPAAPKKTAAKTPAAKKTAAKKTAPKASKSKKDTA